jgi:hypothetical protein
MIKVHYPWEATPLKGGFFVPTLALDKTRIDGLRAAIYNRMKGKAEYGVKDGKLGVWFTRVR